MAKPRLNQIALQRSLKITQDVGAVKVPAGQSYVEISDTVYENGVERKKNMQEVFEEIFTSAQPKVTQPLIELVVTANGSALNKKTFVESGKHVIMVAHVDFSPGHYSYGPSPTGVTATEQKLILVNTAKNTENEIEDGVENSFDIKDGDVFEIHAEVTHTAGLTPKTAQGGNATVPAIASGRKETISNQLCAYRKCFYGLIFNDIDSLTSADIRNLESTSKPLAEDDKLVLSGKSDPSLGTPKGWVVAIPASANMTINALLKTQGIDLTSEFNIATINVADGNEETPTIIAYDVYYFTPAKILGDEVISITFKAE